ncbi:MAG: LysR family transcriptional regulator [Phenylobacterium zucineum]|nr:MAG: LysR family transcriptional regulator [Phenylobacterium zucineum]
MNTVLRGPHSFYGAPGLTPTDLAETLRPHLDEMAAAAGAALRDASGAADGEQGVVRVAVSEFMGVEVLPPILSGFHEKHPDIVIEMVLSDKTEDLSRRDADIAVRTVRPSQGALVARKIGAIRLGFYASESYVARHGVPAGFADLRQGHTLIGYDRERIDLEALRHVDFGGMDINRNTFQVRTDSNVAQVASVRAGLGIGAVQNTLARRWGLVPILPDAFHFELEVWVAMHENLKGSRRMRLMFDHLAESLRAFLAEETGA